MDVLSVPPLLVAAITRVEARATSHAPIMEVPDHFGEHGTCFVVRLDSTARRNHTSNHSNNDNDACMHVRFEDQGRDEAEFLTEFLVCCPRCDRRACVRSDGVPWTVTHARLTCTACGHTDTWSRERPKGKAAAPIRRRCPRCTRWLQKRVTGSPAPREVHLHCNVCGIVVREPQSWMRLPGSLTLDPYFGCRLWLVGDVKGNVFWAYNTAHLAHIRNYVAATLRVREPHRHRSVASRLPAFLLAKKNRAAVLKEIDRLAASLLAS